MWWRHLIFLKIGEFPGISGNSWEFPGIPKWIPWILVKIKKCCGTKIRKKCCGDSNGNIEFFWPYVGQNFWGFTHFCFVLDMAKPTMRSLVWGSSIWHLPSSFSGKYAKINICLLFGQILMYNCAIFTHYLVGVFKRGEGLAGTRDLVHFSAGNRDFKAN